MADETQKLTIVKDGVEETKEIKKPTPEEIEQYKNEFETAVKAFQEKRWDLSEKGAFASNDVALFIQDFMKRFAFWTKNGWMGMIKMNEELQKAMKLVTDETCFSLDYQALEFCAYMLASPGSVGLDAAIEFEKIAEKYAKYGVVIGQRIEEARADLKNVQYLQEKYAASEQGFYIADLEPKMEAVTEDELANPESETEGKVIVMNPTPRE